MNNNAATYARPDVVAHYRSARGLMPPERHLFGRYVKAGMEVLDIGVGGGRTTPYLSTGAKRYLGVDYSAAMVEACRQRFPHLTFEPADATDLSAIPDASFDVAIFSLNGIDYIPTDEGRIRALAEMRRVTREKGHVIISSHNARQLLVYPLLIGLPPHKRMWRIARAAVGSAKLSVRMLGSGVHRAGHGYFRDPVHGGLYTHASTPESIAEDAAAAGLRIVEHVGALYPKRLSERFNNWETYALAHATP